MAFWEQVEADFQAVVSSAESTVQKLEALAGIRNRVSEVQALQAQLTALIDDGAKATADKVVEILTMFGKL